MNYVRIEPKLLPHAGLDEPALDDMHLINMRALATIARLRERNRRLSCRIHPDADNVITVIAHADGTVEVDKNTLCCEEFSARIKGTKRKAKAR